MQPTPCVINISKTAEWSFYGARQTICRSLVIYIFKPFQSYRALWKPLLAISIAVLVVSQPDYLDTLLSAVTIQMRKTSNITSAWSVALYVDSTYIHIIQKLLHLLALNWNPPKITAEPELKKSSFYVIVTAVCLCLQTVDHSPISRGLGFWNRAA